DAPTRGGPAVAAFADRYLAEHVRGRLKPASARRMRGDIANHIVPALGRLPMGAVETAQVAALHYRLRETPAAANGAVNTLSAMYRLAGIWGVLPEGVNPCRGVDRYRTGRPERFLSEREFARLGRALGECEAAGEVSGHAAAAIRLLMLTGCRHSEILSLRWEDVDLKRAALRLRESKTGPKTVPLSAAAVRALSNLTRRDGTPWVVPGRGSGGHLSSLQRSWRRVCERAELEGVRLHDLRHSFASRALALGEGLPMIGKLLGHTQMQSTARYAHLARAAVKASAERVAASLAGDLAGASPRT
ncbi:MAG: tyrosine-type recombinase/integrase, partial [Gammaproteobacteria bacterium]|nr:tyrosine-type recombinase/integrase [Gammaproteobacteria bacterium]